jgi:hypothetical protein
MIFYTFYKIQHLHLDLEETVLRTDPRISQTGPRDGKLDCNWVLGAMAGGGSSIPARGRLGSAGKEGSGVGSPRVPFHGLLAAEEQPTAVLDDAGGLWPQGASAPAGRPATLRNKQLGRLQQGCGEVEELLAGCGGTRRQELAVGASMADDDVVRTRGRSTAAFIAWASRLGFKPSRRRRYPGLQCPSTAAGHRWARLAEEVADRPVGPAWCIQNSVEHEASQAQDVGKARGGLGKACVGRRRERAPARNRFNVPLFDRVFLKIFQLKCTV